MAQSQVKGNQPDPHPDEFCPVCRKWCGEQVGRHINVAHGQIIADNYKKDQRASTPALFKECSICNKVFHRNSLSKHLTSVHGITKRNRAGNLQGTVQGWRDQNSDTSSEATASSFVSSERKGVSTRDLPPIQSDEDKSTFKQPLSVNIAYRETKEKNPEKSSSYEEPDYTMDQLTRALKVMLYQRSAMTYTREAVKQMCSNLIPQLTDGQVGLVTDVAILAAREVATLSQVAAVFRGSPTSTQYMAAIEQIVTLARGPSLDDTVWSRSDLRSTGTSCVTPAFPVVMKQPVSHQHERVGYTQNIPRPVRPRSESSERTVSAFGSDARSAQKSMVVSDSPQEASASPTVHPPSEERPKYDRVKEWIKEYGNIDVDMGSEGESEVSISILAELPRLTVPAEMSVAHVLESIRESRSEDRSLRESEENEVQISSAQKDKQDDDVDNGSIASSGPEVIPGTQPPKQSRVMLRSLKHRAALEEISEDERRCDYERMKDAAGSMWYPKKGKPECREEYSSRKESGKRYEQAETTDENQKAMMSLVAKPSETPQVIRGSIETTEVLRGKDRRRELREENLEDGELDSDETCSPFF